MRRLRPLALAAAALLAGGCRCGDRAAPTPAPGDATIELAVRQDETIIARITLGADRVDLWPWCDRPGIVTLRADGPGGAVLGDCRQRATLRLTAHRGTDRMPVVELVRSASGAVMGRTDGVTSLSLWAAATPPARPETVIRLEIPGASPVDLDRTIIEDHVAQHPQRGALVTTILATHGVPAASLRRVLARAGTDTLELPAAWFTSADDEVRIRFNRRGQAKIVHWFRGEEREQLREVTTLTIEQR